MKHSDLGHTDLGYSNMEHSDMGYSNREHSDRHESPSALGQVQCNLQSPVVAGSYQTCCLEYTAGFAGIDDTGSLKIVMRYATDAGVPQFTDPAAANYVTAEASNAASLQLRYDVKDHVRPWGKTLHVKVLQGFLRQGDRIRVVLGDTTQGSPGWRMQTFAEQSFELRVLIDRYATYVYEPLQASPTFPVVAGEPRRLIAVAPSLVSTETPFVVRARCEDKWGNPVGDAWEWEHAGFADAGCHQLNADHPDTGLVAEVNPVIAVDGDVPHGMYWADLHGQSEETIGTNSIEDYFRFARDRAFLDACAHQGNDFQITDRFWQTIQETTSRFDQPGRFVTFPGWEWSGNTGLGGDRNVLFLEPGGPIFRSSRALVTQDAAGQPCCETVEDLFEQLGSADCEVMLVPHVGGRYADLGRHSRELEHVVEVHSAWGTFEWMLDDAFRLGYRLGIVANSDGHKGRPGASYPGASTFGSYGGLTCVLAERLDRQSLWQAYREHRVYATTGARIVLQVCAEPDRPMGAVVAVDSGTAPQLRVRIAGTDALERVEVCNAMEVIHTAYGNTAEAASPRFKLLWQGAEVRGRGRQVEWDGELVINDNRISAFQTVNFYNPEKVCRQVASGGLQWQSMTTGGVAGVIFELEHPQRGRVAVHTPQAQLECGVDELDGTGIEVQAGGLGKRLAVRRLPPAHGPRTLDFTFTPDWSRLRGGDNPLYVRVVQEDGHMAWSSPITLVKSVS